MTKGIGALAAAILALATSAACTMQQADSAPPLTGPSGFAQDLTVTATPDVLTRDGLSQSAIVVRVFGPNGQPVGAVPVRVDILDSSGTPVDFGTLSTKSIVTGSDGRATTVYTAPPPPPPTAGGGTAIATIRAIALGSDGLNSKSFTADIRLVPPGVILPPAGTPTATFTTSPSNLLAGVAINFDATASLPGSGASAITSYTWSFGDGSSGSGRTTTKTYSTANTYSVTLTVTNDRGVSASFTQSVTLGTAALPTPVFNVSPASPGVGESVFFNASASTAATGRRITGYAWSFGDGGTGGGITVSHAYATAGTYTVTLTVTDDLGQSATGSPQSVTIGGLNPLAPTARFTATVNNSTRNVEFVASTSSTSPGQTITDYFWNFGDDPSCPPVSGTPPTTCYVRTSSSAITHTYPGYGTFQVNLVVRDSAGRTGALSNPVTLTAPTPPAAPIADFTFSPQPAHSTPSSVNFTSTSTTPSGAGIVSYTWNFGDQTTCSGSSCSPSESSPSHAFPVVAPVAPATSVVTTYSVVLTVRDVNGLTSTKTVSVPVTTP